MKKQKVMSPIKGQNKTRYTEKKNTKRNSHTHTN